MPWESWPTRLALIWCSRDYASLILWDTLGAVNVEGHLLQIIMGEEAHWLVTHFLRVGSTQTPGH